MQVNEQTVYLNLLVGNMNRIQYFNLHYEMYIAIVRVSINLELYMIALFCQNCPACLRCT